MGELVFAARSLAASGLGWFLFTRSTVGEDAGKERAININRNVLDEWFPDRDDANEDPIDISSRYLDGFDLTGNTIKADTRTIRNQGGGKNWRLAGEAIAGPKYDMRAQDLMFMVFDKSTNTLSWITIRSGGDSSRTVPVEESQLYSAVLALLGPSDRSMWLIDPDKAAHITQQITAVFPKAGELLMAHKAMMEAWLSDLKGSGFIASRSVERRLPLALQTKRFVILTGLSGSGKTLLARLFAKWISPSAENYVVVPVGSNWTSNENILGYPDALSPDRYVKTAAVEIILRASAAPDEPHILILDEMNLSHVEGYFADFLSAIESPNEPLHLHGDAAERGDVPPFLKGLPRNLFVIGTVNVDETTYMFSPKVLDRANVIEFRADPHAMRGFLENPRKAEADTIAKGGEAHAAEFVARANADSELDATVSAIFSAEMMFLFDVLSKYELEFGFRTAHEIMRYISLARNIEAGLPWDAERDLLRQAFDEQVCQKILPRLHGARKHLEPILLELGTYCALDRAWSADSAGDLSALQLTTQSAVQEGSLPAKDSGAFLPTSHDKIVRLLDRVRRNGFASFAEA
ncbi:McrB family protein [Sphingopyxis sp. USTB-05]|uniref:McrB family protein n=1 Tax=Sphingopyxis sp. USTB-05 TaxID=2830667 RepID=UPI002078F472|nr:AAA family ATPase [Sphingopyxis sp. USTB-05]USI76527.1 AAA family ATPase [Sphingopyxis sp. USTB-05]